MRIGRERLIEWITDIQYDVSLDLSAADTAAQWADRIMEDINLGIITAEVDG